MPTRSHSRRRRHARTRRRQVLPARRKPRLHTLRVGNRQGSIEGVLLRAVREVVQVEVVRRSVLAFEHLCVYDVRET